MIRDSTSWIISGTKTYRLGSRKILQEFGGNLQNIEKSAREIYIPDDGKMFIQTDQSGAEALIVAYLCRAGAFRQLFIHGVKPHVYVALHVFRDVWKKKNPTLDIDTMCTTPIQALKSIEGWRELDLLIKSSDGWPASERYYYLAKQTCHCVDDQTEVLTRKGWKKINTVAKIGQLDEEIAIVSDDRSIKFEIPKAWNSAYLKDTMIKLVGEEVDQLVTQQHMVVYESNKKLSKDYASNARKQLRLNIPTSGYYIGGDENHPEWYVKLLVAIQADGYWYSESNVRFRFSKQRKIERLLSILKEGNLNYEINQTDIVEITVTNLEKILDFFTENKTWNSKLLTWSYSNLCLFIDELKYWDGSYTESHHHKREVYISKHSMNVLWVKTICHLINKQGTVNFNDDVFFAGINNRHRSIAYTKQQVPNWEGYVYCPTVSTGMFLIRRNGKISITGNSSNYGIEPPTFRMNILDKSGGKINISKEDAERFLITYHSLFPEIREWHQNVRRQVEKCGVVYNMHGHPIQITQHNIEEHKWKEIYAIIPQSTVGMITNVAFYMLQEYTEQNGLKWDHLINCHDSILSQAPIDEAILCGAKQREFLEQEFESPVDGTKFRMRSETGIGMNWNSYKEGKNPLGLKECKV